MLSRPDNAHDWVAWLFENLTSITEVGDGQFRGVVPSNYSLSELQKEIERVDRQLLGLIDSSSCVIEFDPKRGHHYESLDHLLEFNQNRYQVPSRFTLRREGYTWPTEPRPPKVVAYVQAVEAWNLLEQLADHVSPSPRRLHFISSPEKQIALVPNFALDDVLAVQGVGEFDRDFVRSELHREQKRNIVRESLVSLFKGRKLASLGELAGRFPEFLSTVRASYATYAADFSFQKVRGEVEKQNLDDTLRIHKTLADIQNQLLALPAALVLAVGGMEPGAHTKNWAIVLGVTVFAGLLAGLIMNQLSALGSIAEEVRIRKARLLDQPKEVSSEFTSAFREIDARVRRQRWVLKGVGSAAFVTWVAVLLLAMHHQAPESDKGVSTPAPQAAHQPSK